MKNRNTMIFQAKEGVGRVNTTNDMEMVRERLRAPLRAKKSIHKKTKEDRQLYRKLAKQQLLENKVMIKFAC